MATKYLRHTTNTNMTNTTSYKNGLLSGRLSRSRANMRAPPMARQMGSTTFLERVISHFIGGALFGKMFSQGKYLRKS